MVIIWDSKNISSCTHLYGIQRILAPVSTHYTFIPVLEHYSYVYSHSQILVVSGEAKRLFFVVTISSVEGAGTGVVEGTRLPLWCFLKGVSKLKRYMKIWERSSGMYKNCFSVFVGTTSQCFVRLRNTRWYCGPCSPSAVGRSLCIL